MDTLSSLASAHHADLRRKVITVIWSLRIVACVYTAWVFWLIVRPLRDTQAFLHKVGNYWHSDMSAAQDWQVWSVVTLDLALWSLLPLAIVCWWLASRHLLRDMSMSTQSSTWLRRGAWAGLTCAVLSILTRPIISYLYTLHLPAESRLWLWNINPSDLLGLLICGVLLMLSYLMAWMSEITEENKAFV
jgi:hypothetical protein